MAPLQSRLLDPSVPSHIACGFPSADPRWNSERSGCVAHASVGVHVHVRLWRVNVTCFGGEGAAGAYGGCGDQGIRIGRGACVRSSGVCRADKG